MARKLISRGSIDTAKGRIKSFFKRLFGGRYKKTEVIFILENPRDKEHEQEYEEGRIIFRLPGRLGRFAKRQKGESKLEAEEWARAREHFVGMFQSETPPWSVTFKDDGLIEVRHPRAHRRSGFGPYLKAKYDPANAPAADFFNNAPPQPGKIAGKKTRTTRKRAAPKANRHELLTKKPRRKITKRKPIPIAPTALPEAMGKGAKREIRQAREGVSIRLTEKGRVTIDFDTPNIKFLSEYGYDAFEGEEHKDGSMYFIHFYRGKKHMATLITENHQTYADQMHYLRAYAKQGILTLIRR